MASVVDFSTVSLMLAINELEGAKIEQLDVKRAYIYEKIDEEVYMSLTKGFDGERSDIVCRFKRSI